jgi:outer membrane biosynthesis protein TonB
MKTKANHRKAVFVSIILHLLFFALLGFMVDFRLFVGDQEISENKKEDAIVFEFEEPKRPIEIVETPDHAKVNEFQDQAKLASDKNALAMNPESNPELSVGEAYSRGDLAFKELPMNQLPPGAEAPQSESQELTKDSKAKETNMNEEAPELYATQEFSEKFQREYLTNPNKSKNFGASENIPKVRYDNRNSRARDTGGMSFNTYDWDFAPYMLALKRKVERNIFPPPAFMYMGLISGETILRFTILPNGEMKNLEVLEYRGHKTLMETSVRAIEISAPFIPLPEDFPEPYLEVTATFNYFVKGKPTN